LAQRAGSLNQNILHVVEKTKPDGITNLVPVGDEMSSQDMFNIDEDTFHRMN